MKHIDYLHCIVVAAGNGTRFGGTIPKQYLTIAGRSCVAHSLQRLRLACRNAGLSARTRFIVVVHPRHGLPDDVASDDVIAIDGGATRQQSVGLALDAIRAHPVEIDTNAPENQWALIHDADRPCVLPLDVENLFERVQGSVGGFLSYGLADSLVEVDRSSSSARMSSHRCERERYRLVATPQLYRLDAVCQAHRLARQKGWSASDDSALVERSGFTVYAIDSSPGNIKLTHPHDRQTLAERLREVRMESR